MKQSNFEILKKEVFLPLFSFKGDVKYLPAKSGLNQWLSSGRARRFGECYIPIPSVVHKVARGFFPEHGVTFKLRLPEGLDSRAKLCQSGSKALMTSPNHHLGIWLFKLLDEGSIEREERVARNLPYSYQDLQRIGIDSVSITKIGDSYALAPSGLGAYESWISKKLND